MDASLIALTVLNLAVCIFSIQKLRQQNTKVRWLWLGLAFIGGILTGVIPFLYFIMQTCTSPYAVGC